MQFPHLTRLQGDLLSALGDLFNSIAGIGVRLHTTLLGSLHALLCLLGRALSLFTLLVGFASRSFGLLLGLLLLQLLTTEKLAPLLLLLGLDGLEQVGGFADLVVAGDGVRLPLVGNDEELTLKLREDCAGGGGEVGGNGRGQEVDVVDREVDDSIAALTLVGEEVVVESVLLEEAVAER